MDSRQAVGQRSWSRRAGWEGLPRLTEVKRETRSKHGIAGPEARRRERGFPKPLRVRLELLFESRLHGSRHSAPRIVYAVSCIKLDIDYDYDYDYDNDSDPDADKAGDKARDKVCRSS
jgi:hypothetical protein